MIPLAIFLPMLIPLAIRIILDVLDRRRAKQLKRHAIRHGYRTFVGQDWRLPGDRDRPSSYHIS